MRALPTHINMHSFILISVSCSPRKRIVSIILWINIDIWPHRRCINIFVEFIVWPRAIGYTIIIIIDTICVYILCHLHIINVNGTRLRQHRRRSSIAHRVNNEHIEMRAKWFMMRETKTKKKKRNNMQ